MTCTGVRRLLLAARRRLRRMLDVRFLGTPTAHLFMETASVQLDGLEHGQPGVHDLALAAALRLVEVLSTLRAEPLALVLADHRDGERQQYLFLEDGVQIDRAAVEVFAVRVPEREGPRAVPV